MTDRQLNAFIAWFASKRFPFGLSDPRAEEMHSIWQAACEACSQPPQPEDGALVLPAGFFERK